MNPVEEDEEDEDEDDDCLPLLPNLQLNCNDDAEEEDCSSTIINGIETKFHKTLSKARHAINKNNEITTTKQNKNNKNNKNEKETLVKRHIDHRSLPELVCGYLKWLSWWIQFGKSMCVSVRLGKLIPKHNLWKSSKQWRVSIEDPFECYDSIRPHDLGWTIRQPQQQTKLLLACETALSTLVNLHNKREPSMRPNDWRLFLKLNDEQIPTMSDNGKSNLSSVGNNEAIDKAEKVAEGKEEDEEDDEKLTGVVVLWNKVGFGFIQQNSDNSNNNNDDDNDDDKTLLFCSKTSILEGDYLLQDSKVQFNKVLNDYNQICIAENVIGGIRFIQNEEANESSHVTNNGKAEEGGGEEDKLLLRDKSKDWICLGCGGTNFSFRTCCYRCDHPKPTNKDDIIYKYPSNAKSHNIIKNDENDKEKEVLDQKEAILWKCNRCMIEISSYKFSCYKQQQQSDACVTSNSRANSGGEGGGGRGGSCKDDYYFTCYCCGVLNINGNEIIKNEENKGSSSPLSPPPTSNTFERNQPFVGNGKGKGNGKGNGKGKGYGKGKGKGF